LYRIAREALRNIAKHAGRTHVEVLLRGGSEAIRLQILDYGEGFDVHAPRSGLGLIGMEERARMWEGKFSVESEIGEGTRISPEQRGSALRRLTFPEDRFSTTGRSHGTRLHIAPWNAGGNSLSVGFLTVS